MIQIRFIPEQYLYWLVILLVSGCISSILGLYPCYLLYPLVNILQRLKMRDIIDKQDGVSIMYIGIKHLTRYGCAIYIPELERNVNIAYKLKTLLKEVNTYGLFVVLVKIVLTVPRDHLGFAYGRVAYDDDFVGQVFRLGLLITTRIHCTFLLFCVHFFIFYSKIDFLFIYFKK